MRGLNKLVDTLPIMRQIVQDFHITLVKTIHEPLDVGIPGFIRYTKPASSSYTSPTYEKEDLAVEQQMKASHESYISTGEHGPIDCNAGTDVPRTKRKRTCNRAAISLFTSEEFYLLSARAKVRIRTFGGVRSDIIHKFLFRILSEYT